MQKATAQQLKEHNQRLVLKNIYTGRADSRAAIAQETGLTRPTISQIVGELLEAGLVREEGPGESSGGKPPTLLSFADDAYQVIGLHVGGRDTLGVVADLRGKILARASYPTDRTDEQSVLAGIFRLLDDLLEQASQPLLGIGVSTPGLVDHHNGVVRYSAHLNWQDVALSEEIAKHCGDSLTICVDNDTNLAALGEQVFGVGIGVNDLAIVMAGTRGIGAGLILNGEIHHGVGGGAGEIGHMPVSDNGVPCVCGRHGCLEAVSSGWALVGRAQQAAATRADTTLNLLDPAGLTFDDLRQAVTAGDPTAAALVRSAGRYMGMAVAILISTINPQRVVVGGSVAELGEPFFDGLHHAVSDHTLTLLAEETEVLAASLGPDVHVLGAVAQVLKAELGVV